MICALFAPHIINLLSWMRTSKGARRFVHTANETEIATRDETGLMLTVPWSLVRKANVRGGWLILTLEGRRVRIYSRNEFSDADFERIVDRARRATVENAGAAA